MSLDAVIFDLDGVITDTAAFHERGWQRLADEQGWQFDSTLADALRGVSRVDSLERILAENRIEASDQQKREWADRKNRYYVDALSSLTPSDLLSGALELIRSCKEHGLAVAIGSSSKNAQLVLERLGITGLFATVSDGHSVERAKPAPDLFLHAAGQLGIAPERCAVLEDAQSGVDAALSAGMVAVGIGPSERVGHAHHRFDSVADVTLEDVLAHWHAERATLIPPGQEEGRPWT